MNQYFKRSNSYTCNREESHDYIIYNLNLYFSGDMCVRAPKVNDNITNKDVDMNRLK